MLFLILVYSVCCSLLANTSTMNKEKEAGEMNKRSLKYVWARSPWFHPWSEADDLLLQQGISCQTHE
jgi:hypothetical protein